MGVSCMPSCLYISSHYRSSSVRFADVLKDVGPLKSRLKDTSSLVNRTGGND